MTSYRPGSLRRALRASVRWTARVVVHLASMFVPAASREEWLAEWRAELWHLEHGEEVGRDARDAAAGEGSRRVTEWQLLKIAMGSMPDALTVRKLAARARPRSARRPPRGAGESSRGASFERERGGGMTGWGNDLRTGVRSLLRSPGFTAIAVGTLALGIGGSTTTYALLDRVVWSPLPYPDADRLVRLRNVVPCVGEGTEWDLSTAQFVLFDDEARSLEALGVYRLTGANARVGDAALRVEEARMTASMLELLGARASAGRLFGPDDDAPDGPPVVLLSHAFWQTSYGADPDVVGRSVALDDRRYTIVGVLAPELSLPSPDPGVAARTPEVWTPIRVAREGPFVNSHTYPAVGRLAPSADAAAAQAEIDGLLAQLPERFPEVYAESGLVQGCGMRTEVRPLKTEVVGEMARHLWVLFGAVGLVLLVACANVVNLLGVRVEGRRRELAVREAMGAGSAALVRTLLSETVVLGLTGGLLGLLLAHLALPAVAAVAPDGLPRLGEVGVGPGAAAFAVVLSLAIGAALGVLPVLLRERSVVRVLRDGGRGHTGGRGPTRLRDLLVVGQVALAVTLLVGAGLMFGSVRHLVSLDPGFEPEGVVTAEISLTTERYPDNPAVWGFVRELRERVGGLPGVTGVGVTRELPATGGFGCWAQGFEDPEVHERIQAAGVTTCAAQEPTSPGYFEAMGIPVVRGRGLQAADLDDPGRAVAVVGEAFAARFFGDSDPIGRRIGPSGTRAPDFPMYTIVGVVGDVPRGSPAGEPALAAYYPLVWAPDAPVTWNGGMSLAVRTEVDSPLSLVPAIREAVSTIDASIPLDRVRTMDSVLAASRARVTFVALLLQVAAGLALVLAAVGLYGVVSYLVTSRTREIGTRMALGAAAGRVRMRILGRSLALAGAGLALGIGVSLVATRALEGLLVGVRPTDPLLLAVAAGILLGVATLASWVPAWRASRLDPAWTLRAQ